jgi:NADPH:quinone reductase-like Zn-dependent oxidoreductase
MCSNGPPVDTLLFVVTSQVLVQVQYVELNPVDLQKLMPHRAGQEIPQAPLVVGHGGGGFVVRSNVDNFKEGDEIIFLADPRRNGAFATHVVVDAQCVGKIPQ